jgi:hypothetical protein
MASNTNTQCTNQIYLLVMESKQDNPVQQSDRTKYVNNELLEPYYLVPEQNTEL